MKSSRQNTSDLYVGRATYTLWPGIILRNLEQASLCSVTGQNRRQFFSGLGFPCGSAGKESACNVGDLGSIPGLGRSPGEGKGYPLQYSGLENSMDCIVHGVTKSRIRLSGFHSLALFSGCRWQILNQYESGT